MDNIATLKTFVTGEVKTKIKEEILMAALNMSRLKSDQETHRENSKAIISITEKLDILDNDLNEEIANIFIDKVSPGSDQTSIIGSKIEISIAKPLTEDLEKVHFKSKMGSIKLPPAGALGLSSGTSIGIKVILSNN